MFHAASAQKYVDASTLTIIGRTCPMEGHPYYRVDTTRYRFDNATIRHYCGYPAGVAVLFTTDSRRIEARWTTAPRSYGWNRTGTPAPSSSTWTDSPRSACSTCRRGANC